MLAVEKKPQLVGTLALRPAWLGLGLGLGFALGLWLGLGLGLVAADP